MKVLITGAKGMLGRTLARHLGDHELILVDIDDFDLTHPKATHDAITGLAPDVVIHGAAMTAVDRCETEEDAAFKVNALASAHVAGAARDAGARLIAISTDYVFAGDLDRPYHEFDPTGPTNAYGRSKLAGEEAVRAHCPNHLICRISWLYGPGGPSFVHTMMKLLAQEGPPLKVVDDQLGNPTSTDAVALHLKRLLEVPLQGVCHLTCEGEATWYQLTQEIARQRGATRGVTPCTTDEYPRPARRPANSRLDKRVLRLAGLPPMPHWQDALTRFFAENPAG
jgi:dTDP-4-dehydrorhamnose reductase